MKRSGNPQHAPASLPVENFDYELPPHAIAQQPLRNRDQARLLVALDDSEPRHCQVRDLPDLLTPGDVVVVNDARVLPARMFLRKKTGAKIEILALRPSGAIEESSGAIEESSGAIEESSGAIEESSGAIREPSGAIEESSGAVEESSGAIREPTGAYGKHNEDTKKHSSTPDTWEVLVKPGRKAPPGTILFDPGDNPVLEVGAQLDDGKRLARPLHNNSIENLMEQLGQVPLPPYITQTLDNPERYQSVYSKQATAVAAPTAGLHLSEELLNQLRSKNIAIHTLNLSVGLGTFRPVTHSDITQHPIHSEQYSIPVPTWEACLKAKSENRRVVAIGTTVVRALESAVWHSSFAPQSSTNDNPTDTTLQNTQQQTLLPSAQAATLQGDSDLFILPGHRFAVVDVLLTNFHLPRSTLLVLLAAFMGDQWKKLYSLALKDGYRFLSFGDAMLICRADRWC